MAKVIWTNGCFDILHRGHIEMLKYAKACGDTLIVGIDTDDRVKLAKGHSRPINNAADRKMVLESIEYVDKVVIFDTDEELSTVIKNNNVDTMVVGSDWRGKEVIGAKNANSVLFFDRIRGYSTTRILESLK
jgi:D-beta-D-heptose 7-phosphate kinase/D-beta-D-heptose 1-phosphate adenosyltransferase